MTSEKIVKQAIEWLGRNEADGTHKAIIDIYNSNKPLARGYAVTYSDAWCATFVSAVAIKCGATGIIPTECSCYYMIELFKKLDRWVEADNYKPYPGDIIFYDWDDSGKGDNTGSSDHVGIVEKVVGDTITVIEGNYSNAVKRRYIKINGKFIRGYGVPNYLPVTVDAANNNLATVKQITVKEFQLAAIADGFKFPIYGADGVYGAETESVASKAIVKKRLVYINKNLTKLVQKALGCEVDGLCGKETRAAIIAYQEKVGLAADGVVGIRTWRKLLNLD